MEVAALAATATAAVARATAAWAMAAAGASSPVQAAWSARVGRGLREAAAAVVARWVAVASTRSDGAAARRATSDQFGGRHSGTNGDALGSFETSPKHLKKLTQKHNIEHAEPTLYSHNTTHTRSASKKPNLRPQRNQDAHTHPCPPHPGYTHRLVTSRPRPRRIPCSRAGCCSPSSSA